MAVMTLTENNFENEVEQHQGFALVDFWATWCGPCKMIAPTIEELSTEYADSLKVGKLDVDNNTEIASRFGIRSIPCLILFKEGKEHDRIVGAHNKAQLKGWLDEKMNS